MHVALVLILCRQSHGVLLVYSGILFPDTDVCVCIPLPHVLQVILHRKGMRRRNQRFWLPMSADKVRVEGWATLGTPMHAPSSFFQFFFSFIFLPILLFSPLRAYLLFLSLHSQSSFNFLSPLSLSLSSPYISSLLSLPFLLLQSLSSITPLLHHPFTHTLLLSLPPFLPSPSFPPSLSPFSSASLHHLPFSVYM